MPVLNVFVWNKTVRHFYGTEFLRGPTGKGQANATSLHGRRAAASIART